jgi:hypothetical protein
LRRRAPQRIGGVSLVAQAHLGDGLFARNRRRARRGAGRAGLDEQVDLPMPGSPPSSMRAG